MAVVGHLLPVDNFGIHAGYGIRSGLALDPGQDVRLTLGSDFDWWYARRKQYALTDVYAHMAWMPTRTYEMRLAARQRRLHQKSTIMALETTWMIYF